MKLAGISLMLTLALAPVPVFAHGELPAASHGGLMQEAGEMYLELVVKGADVAVYVLDESRKPVSALQITGTATILFSGKLYKVDLSPDQANGVQGKLPVTVTGKVVATVALKIGNKSAAARFAGA